MVGVPPLGTMHSEIHTQVELTFPVSVHVHLAEALVWSVVGNIVRFTVNYGSFGVKFKEFCMSILHKPVKSM